jgi:hypothetical protein
MKAAGDRAAEPVTVRLGTLQARTWRGVQAGGAAATFYVGYTSSGPLVAVCGNAPAGIAPRSCRSALETLSLNGPRPIPIATIDGLRSRFESTIATLRKTWIERRAALAAAPIASAQARQAGALETSFTEASSAIAAMRIPPGVTDVTPVVSALGQAADGYGALADSIRSADNTAYDGARADILAGEAQLETAVARAAIP